MSLTIEEREVLMIARQLKLFGIAAEAEAQYESPHSYRDMSYTNRLLLCLHEELRLSQQRAYEALLRKAKFKDTLTLSHINTDIERGLSAANLTKISQLKWFTEQLSNLIITGPTGTGKTALACAIGRHMCSKGISTLYYRTRDLLNEFHSKEMQSKALFRKRINAAKVVILDDFALDPFSFEDVSVLLSIAEDRYGSGIFIIAGQVTPTGMKSSFNQGANAESLADRLFHPSISIELKGESQRGKHDHRLENKS